MSSASDFDFWPGDWHVRNRWLRERLAGSDEWEEFEATSTARLLLDGFGNEDEFRTDHAGGLVGMSFRFFDPRRSSGRSTGRTAAGLARSTRRSSACSPATSASSTATTSGRAVRSASASSGRGDDADPALEQSFSDDGGETWETNRDGVHASEGRQMSVLERSVGVSAGYRHVYKRIQPAPSSRRGRRC